MVINMARSKGKGWHDESRRHSLARRGIRTVIDDSRRLPVNRFVARGKEEPKTIQELAQYYAEFFEHAKRDSDGRGYLPASRLVAGGIKYLGKGTFSRGTLDRSYQEYLFKDENGDEISVIVFLEPSYTEEIPVMGDEFWTDTKELSEAYGAVHLGEPIDVVLWKGDDGWHVEPTNPRYGGGNWDEEYAPHGDEQAMDVIHQIERWNYFSPGNMEVEVVWNGALDFTGNVDEFRRRYPDLYEPMKDKLVVSKER